VASPEVEDAMSKVLFFTMEANEKVHGEEDEDKWDEPS
jgi:hypothetical protein